MTEAIYTQTVYPTYSPDQIKQMQYDLGVYQTQIQEVKDHNSALTRQVQERSNMIDNVRTLVRDAFESEHFSKTAFEEIAEALEMELTQDYDVSVTITFNGSVTVPLGYDMEMLENDLQTSLEAYGSEIEADFWDQGEMDIDFSRSN